MLFQCKMDISAKIIYPHFLSLHLGTGRTFVKENDICLYSRFIKIPVGRRRIVCSSVVSSNFLRMISPAPPSNRTLSGTTTAAFPVGFKMVLICCTKFNCLLELVVQKSCLLYMRSSSSCSPSSLVKVSDDFFPKGGLVNT